MSGTGRVAAGVLLPSGKVVLEWIVGTHRSMEIWPDVDSCLAVHGHSGKTIMEWIDQ